MAMRSESGIYPGSGLGRPAAGGLGAVFVHGFLSVFRDLAGVVARRARTGRERRLVDRTIRELSMLDDATLRDIGFARSGIGSVARSYANRGDRLTRYRGD